MNFISKQKIIIKMIQRFVCKPKKGPGQQYSGRFEHDTRRERSQLRHNQQKRNTSNSPSKLGRLPRVGQQV